MSKETENPNESFIPTISEDSNSLGDIRINHSVVASIVRLAALEVTGVAAVGGGFVDGIAEDLITALSCFHSLSSASESNSRL